MEIIKECDIHDFFEMLFQLDIVDEDDLVREPYDMLGWTIIQDYEDVVLLKTRTKRWIEWK